MIDTIPLLDKQTAFIYIPFAANEWRFEPCFRRP